MAYSSDDDDLPLYDYNPEVITGGYCMPSINAVDGINSLVAGIVVNDVQGIKMLIANKFELNLVDNRGFTALHEAVAYNRLDIVKILLEQPGIRYNSQNHFGETPLFLSLNNSCKHEIISLLIDHGCDVNISNNEKVSPLHLAVRNDNTDIGLKLILKGADVNSVDRDGYTPLHEAAFRGKFDNVCMLLYYDALPNERTNFSQATPLQMACSNKSHVKTARCLLDYVVDLEETDANGFTALLIALRFKSDVALDLVERDANLYVMQEVPCIIFSLLYSTSNIFEAMWRRIDYKKLMDIGYCILHGLLRRNLQFSIEDFLKCLYMIFESPYIHDIINQVRGRSARYCTDYLYGAIADHRELSVEKRIEIFSLFLSYGIPIYFGDIVMVFTQYGLDKSLETILTSGCCIELYCHENIANKLVSQICYNDRTLADSQNKNSKTRKKRLLEDGTCPKFELPSLMELSRDTVRTTIFKTCNKPYAFNAYRAIISLELPKIIIDILFLKDIISKTIHTS